MRSRLLLTRSGTWIILFAILLALAPQPALAADIRGNDSVVIDADTVVEDDLLPSATGWTFGAPSTVT